MANTLSERGNRRGTNEAFDGAIALEAILSVVKATQQRTGRAVQLHEPLFRGREREYVLNAIDSTFVSSVGEYVNRYERELAAACGVDHAVVTMNGTAALHVCQLLVGVVAGDEVLVPALTFVATANAVTYCGATPHFCDVSTKTLGLDPSRLDAHLHSVAELADGGCRNRITGRRIAAVMPMHTFGHPVELDELLEVCRRWGLPLVEDAAEGLGSRYKGRHVGGFGRVGALSFNGNKIVTTGGGGAVLTNDAGLARRAKHLTTTAKLPHRWAFNHDELGYNYRLPNLNAALGCAQLEQLPEFLGAKRRLALQYAQAFGSVPGARIFQDAEFAESNYWLVTMLLEDGESAKRDQFLELCHENQVLVRPVWASMHRQPAFRDCPRADLSITEDLEGRIVNLPSSVFITEDNAA